MSPSKTLAQLSPPSLVRYRPSCVTPTKTRSGVVVQPKIESMMPRQNGELPPANRWRPIARLSVQPAFPRKDELLRSSHLFPPLSVVTSDPAFQLRFPHVSNVPIVPVSLIFWLRIATGTATFSAYGKSSILPVPPCRSQVDSKRVKNSQARRERRSKSISALKPRHSSALK